ncbi:hypothetical protein N483_18490 [Pseudoalteromonas luteoviolacea NCIMB 1944]|uniref:Uncharacterized protein n=1 Tax=Pseudoalteromonas luteoviolacea (strain 2ta16) TaxID=1353533 RepID=V4H260_PSEL2|nr:hypothetical protein PL2TA16_00330 [Pseudoalteromonas luteoviolacea 2ta16]KZN40179.1 hypothetical protein N483_18490 [Pseudoalteromonas luteoviolacea NCIMB 1944]
MSTAGIVIFAFLFITFILIFRSFVIFTSALRRGQFKLRELNCWLGGSIIFVLTFCATMHYHEELGIKKTCAQNAASC